MFCTVYCSLLQSTVPQVHKLGLAAVKGVARNKNITEFQLSQRVVDGILAQLTADERKKFRVGQRGWPFSIELCSVGEWCIVNHAVSVMCQSSPQSVVP